MTFAEDGERPLSVEFGLGDVPGNGHKSCPKTKDNAGTVILGRVRAAAQIPG
jgi:hypothetical protein